MKDYFFKPAKNSPYNIGDSLGVCGRTKRGTGVQTVTTYIPLDDLIEYLVMYFPEARAIIHEKVIDELCAARDGQKRKAAS